MDFLDWTTLASLVAVVLLIGAVYWALQWWVDRSTGTVRKEREGLGGWLAFYVGASATLGNLLAVGQHAGHFALAEYGHPSLREWAPWVHYRNASWVIVAAFVAWNLWVCWNLVYRREPASVRKVKLYLLLAVPAGAAAELVNASIFLRPDQVVSAGFIGSTLGSWLGALLWYLYFSRSRRVRGTYGLVTPEHVVLMPSGPVRPTTASPTSIAPTTDPAVFNPSELSGRAGSAEERLLALRRLLEKGLISEGEHARKKTQILDGL